MSLLRTFVRRSSLLVYTPACKSVCQRSAATTTNRSLFTTVSQLQHRKQQQQQQNRKQRRHQQRGRLTSFHTSAGSLTSYQISDLTDENYHRVSDNTLHQMVDILEAIGDETDLEGFDLEYSQGVMTLKLGDHGTYVINKQPPNKQIWLSSPKSGPKRYDYDATKHKWFYSRDNHTLDELLNNELKEVLGDIDVLEGLEQV